MILKQVAGRELKSHNDLDQALAFIDYRESAEIVYTDKPDGESATKSLVTEPWPKSLSDSRPAEAPKDESQTKSDKKQKKEKAATGIVPITMGDVPNQVFAFVPPNYRSDAEYGLLVVMPEPGKIDRKQWVDRWEVFCRNHRYILAVVGAADPTAWQRDELDIVKRAVQQLRGNYSIDPRRLVIGGIGAGGAPAMVLALQNRAMFRGVWLVECSIPRGLTLPQAEPLESPALLMQGSNPMFPKVAEQANSLGYRAAIVEEKIDLGVKILDDKNQKEVESFLRSLEWF